MSLKVGIVGLPNVGKSTLFNALLKRQQALVANYPFATIEPNVGVVAVPDERLERLADVIAKRDSSTTLGMTERPPIVPATVEFVDIAGLVAGAATGAGLGNKFLSHIREVDVIIQVLRDFSDAEVVKEGSVDPKSDYEVVTSELILKDLETVEKLKNSKTLKLKTKENEKLIPLIDKLYAGLNSGKPARTVLAGEEKEMAADLFLLTMKPEVKVLNVSESDLGVRPPSGEIVICAKIEAELSGLSEEDARAYMKELGITESGLDKLIRKAYETLGLMSFLTAGQIEVRAWTIRRGTKSPAAAGVIHTDFEKKFVKAKVVTFEDFVASGGWKGAAEAGKVRLEGKDYMMREGDVVEFMIGA